jgi:alkylation response protein AidB-like acyl-CoA dehydrogenase
MDLSYTDEQRLLQESANNLLAARAAKAGAQDLWSEIAGLGWLGLPLPEADGGLGQSTVDVAIVAEAMGRHLVSAPFVSNVVLCGGLVAALGSESQRALLPALADGKLRLALAHAEEGARYDLRHVATKAMRESDGWTLHGRKLAVLAGGDADKFLVSGRIAGTTRDAQRVGLFLIDRNAAGVSVEAYATVDGGSAARVTLDNAKVGADARLGGDDALAHIEHAYDRAIAAWASELVGLMEAATAATIEYTKIRVQFGKPLAVNQVLRHRMADMSIACEEARSMALRAAIYADHEDGTQRARAVAGAWAKVSRAARFVAEQAVQLHGGMGVTNELQIGGYLKRVLALDAIVGGPDHHLRRHAALSVRGAHAA